MTLTGIAAENAKLQDEIGKWKLLLNIFVGLTKRLHHHCSKK